MATIEVEVEGIYGTVYEISETPPEDQTVIWLDSSVGGVLAPYVYSGGDWEPITPNLEAATGNDRLGIETGLNNGVRTIGLALATLGNIANDVPLDTTDLPIYEGALGSNRKLDWYNSKMWSKVKNYSALFGTVLTPVELSQTIGYCPIANANNIEIQMPNTNDATVSNGSGARVKMFTFYVDNLGGSGVVIFKNTLGATLYTSGNVDGTIINAFSTGSTWYFSELAPPQIQGLTSTAATGESILATLSNKVQNFKKILGSSLISVTSNADNVIISTSAQNNTASNVGGGAGVFKQKSGSDLQMKSLTAGANVTITPGTDDIVIAASGGGGSSVIEVTEIDFIDGTFFANNGATYICDQDSDYRFIINGSAPGGPPNPNILNICIDQATQLWSEGRTITIIDARDTRSPASDYVQFWGRRPSSTLIFQILPPNNNPADSVADWGTLNERVTKLVFTRVDTPNGADFVTEYTILSGV